MRRALASVLMLVFSFPLIAPVFASAAAPSSLPACCRRNGRHHCAMTGMAVPARYLTISEKCPYSGFPGLSLMLPHAFSANQTPAVVAPIAGAAAIVREAEAGYRISFDRSRQKRGPPQLAL